MQRIRNRTQETQVDRVATVPPDRDGTGDGPREGDAGEVAAGPSLRRSVALDLFRLGRLAATGLPASVARGLAQSGAVAVSRRPGGSWEERRQMLARHLRRVLGEDAPPADSRQMGRLVDQAVASYARYWAESLKIPGLSPAELTAGIVYEGFEHIAAGRAAGRGTILVLPHVGGWEWAGAQLASVGHPMSVVVERLEPPELFDWFVSFRRRLGMQVIPLGPGAVARCAAALADNHILCLLSDRLIAGTTGVEVEFFGERTILPAGPATLALRTGAPLLPVGVYFEARTDHHLGIISPSLDLARRSTLRADVQRVTQDLAREFEVQIRRAPTQWHLMQPNWPSDTGGAVGGPAGLVGGPPPGPAGAPGPLE